MGFTTIIEVNNDYLADIEQAPDKFVLALREQISFAGNAKVHLPGGKVVAMFHRNDGENLKWLRFKKRLGWR